ncbi:MAG: hypothetical protein EON53_00315 [Actinomycetales bacterium]|nr:MAG: hypothetical protein EON53_00315 [Actinomycetales bacterium]
MLLRTRRSERGQGSLEIVGVIVLASILVLATTGTIVQTSPQLKAEVSYRICQILNIAGGGDCEPPRETPTPEERIPDAPCVVGSDKGSVKVTGSFIVTVAVGKELLVEELSDGTYRVSEVDLGKVGIGVGPGIDVSVTLDGKKYGAVASATAEALLAGRTGRTWYADDEAGVDDILNGLLADQIKDSVAPEIPGPADVPGINKIPILGDIEGPPNPLNSLLDQFVDGVPDADEEFVEGGIEGNASASASNIVVGAGVRVEAGAYLGAKTTPDGYVAYYRSSVKGDAFGTFTGVDASATASGDGLYALNMDKDGKPQSVTLTMGVSYGADAGDIASNSDDQTYKEYQATVPLTGDPLQDAPILAALTGNPLATSNFINAARDFGTMTENTYSQDPNTYGINISGELLGEIGGSAEVDFTNRELTDSKYWDGSQFVDRPDC